MYVLLPIMLSISVCLLLAGWKGVRGGLSQLIYHIKYQPSSALSPYSPYSNIPLFSHSLFSPHPIYISPSHLSPPLFYHFFNLPVKVPLLFPHTSSSKPSGNFFLLVKVHISLFSTTAICLCASPHACPALTLSP